MEKLARAFAAASVLATSLGACANEEMPRQRPSDASSARGSGGDGDASSARGEREASDTSDVPPQPAEANDNPVGVLPVFFVARGAELGDADFRRYRDRLFRHLRIAQRFYLSQLRTETFRTEDDALVYRSPYPAAHYGDPMTDPDPAGDIGNQKVKELFDRLGEDRFSSTHVFVILFVRPKDEPCGERVGCLGFGRPFSGGPPVIGGGVVELDMEGLVTHETSPFQSTLAHELGHAFGLAHADCHGYDMSTNDSIMSYNLAHHSRGYAESATPGVLIAEDFFVLARNKGVLPGFDYSPARHNPRGAPLQYIDDCYIPPMNSGLGEAPPASPLGYRLYFDGEPVSGPETAYWGFAQAKAHCKAMVESAPQIQVRCTFNGVGFDPAGTP